MVKSDYLYLIGMVKSDYLYPISMVKSDYLYPIGMVSLDWLYAISMVVLEQEQKRLIKTYYPKVSIINIVLSLSRTLYVYHCD